MHGGFETFAERLALYMHAQGWDVTVYCVSETKRKSDQWNGIHRVFIQPAFKGPLGTLIFDAKAMLHCLLQKKSLMLTLGYNSGLLNFIPCLFRRRQIINMDGVEWKRGKWSKFYKAAFYFNYWCAGLAANRLIADNPGIEKILKWHFKPAKTIMIPYGADKIESADVSFLEKFKLKPKKYAIVIARPEPENQILEIVRTWSLKKRGLKLVVLGKFDPLNVYHRAIIMTASSEVLFPGAIYDMETVKALRFYAHLYIHGHSVGGTNPSLVEALGAGNTIIAHDNVYNRWVAGSAAFYFRNKRELEILLDEMPSNERNMAYDRVAEAFTWDKVLEKYLELIQRSS